MKKRDKSELVSPVGCSGCRKNCIHGGLIMAPHGRQITGIYNCNSTKDKGAKK